MKIQYARAVVTGGASGLGDAVARHLVSLGGKAVIVDVQDGPGRLRRPISGPTPPSCAAM